MILRKERELVWASRDRSFSALITDSLMLAITRPTAQAIYRASLKHWWLIRNHGVFVQGIQELRNHVYH